VWQDFERDVAQSTKRAQHLREQTQTKCGAQIEACDSRVCDAFVCVYVLLTMLTMLTMLTR